MIWSTIRNASGMRRTKAMRKRMPCRRLNAASPAHDSFARMTTDAEAGLTITYNVPDLPERISQGTTLKVKYTYLADGTKVSALDASGAGLVYHHFLLVVLELIIITFLKIQRTKDT